MKKTKNIQISMLRFPIMLIASLFLLSCANTLKEESFDEMVENARANADAISTSELEAIVSAEDVGDYLIIDCRQGADFLESHIPGAISIPRGKLEFSNKISNRRDKIIIYGYDDAMSALAAETLRKLKYHNVRMLDKGWEAWMANYPELIESGPGDGEAEAAPVVEPSGGCG